MRTVHARAARWTVDVGVGSTMADGGGEEVGRQPARGRHEAEWGSVG